MHYFTEKKYHERNAAGTLDSYRVRLLVSVAMQCANENVLWNSLKLPRLIKVSFTMNCIPPSSPNLYYQIRAIPQLKGILFISLKSNILSEVDPA